MYLFYRFPFSGSLFVWLLLTHGYVKGISISAVTVEAKAVRQVQYALFTLSANTPRKRMIMSVHCTVKSYQNIFLVLPPHDGQRKRATRFVSEGCFLFCFVFSLTWSLVIRFLSLALLPCFDDWTVLFGGICSPSDLWLMREHEFCWEIYFHLIFFSSWVSHMFYSVLPNVKILSFASLWRVIAIGGIKFLNQKMKFLHPFSYMCSPKLKTKNSFYFFPFWYGNVLKEIQNILEYMNILD